MKLFLSWNVNGIRAAYAKGLTHWLGEHEQAAINLQEIKAFKEQVPTPVQELLSPHHHAIYHPAQRPGYAGVATIFPKAWGEAKVTIGLGIERFDREGRMIVVEWDDLVFYGGYYPNGQRDHGRVDFKLEFSEAVLQHALKKKKETGKVIVLTGDFNTAHAPIDLKNPKQNENTTGFLPKERAWLDRLTEAGFVDCYRMIYPEQTGAYTWWTYRGDCRVRNIGWRIDYFFIDADNADKVLDCFIQPEVMGSDHCPVGLVLDL
jgi:exodeoxyribonuclease III